MWRALQRLAFGLCLILLASATLLISDLKSRQARAARDTAAASKTFRIAILQQASQPTLEDGVRGMIAGLNSRGFADGKNISIQRFNAEGDMATATTIAQQMTDGSFDLILTASTPSLQAVANANAKSKIPHVFGLVTDPYGAGVGISREHHQQHPPYLAGFGTMQPVEASFQIARQMNPALRRVGVVWNSSESNSEAQLKIARAVCQQLGIQLIEANADNSSAVGEAASSLAARGAEALWVPGDVTVLTALDALIKAADKNNIPTFTVIPPSASKGALFDIGADYFEVGRLAGELAAEILNGRSPSSVSVDNVVPENIIFNLLAAQRFKSWTISPQLLARAHWIIDQSGKHPGPQTTAGKTKTSSSKKIFKVHLIEYNDILDVKESEEGIRQGFLEAGFSPGRDFVLNVGNAQGDMSTLTSLADLARAQQADLIMTVSTPALQAALRRAPNLPIVFTYCANAIAAGAGKSATNHLPNVTGVETSGAYDDLIRVAKECLPQIKKVGTLFVPSEVNMVFHKEKFTAATKRLGVELVAVAAETSAEVPSAATALCGQGIDAICQIPGNLTAASFPSITQAARSARIPLFGSQSAQAYGGAAVAVARDYHDAGIDAAHLALRVLQGENPATLPFETFSKTKILINPAAAKAFGLRIPPSLLQRADKIIDTPPAAASFWQPAIPAWFCLLAPRQNLFSVAPHPISISYGNHQN